LRFKIIEQGHRMKICSLGVVLAFLLTACSGGGGSGTSGSGATAPTSSSSSSGGSQPTSQTEIIDHEDLSSGLKGVDKNANGIRDDIDRLIATKYAKTPALKRAAEQMALALQSSMESVDRSQALIAGDKIVRASACISKALPDVTQDNENTILAISRELSALTANTQERFTAYWKAEELGSGAVYKEPLEPVCD